MSVWFADDSHSVNICRYLRERKDLPPTTSIAFAAIVAAVGVDAGRVATIHRHTVVGNIYSRQS